MKRLFAVLTLTFFAATSAVSAFTPLLAQSKAPKKCCCQTRRESSAADMLGLQLKNKPCGCEFSKTSGSPQTPLLAPTVPSGGSFETLAFAAIPTSTAFLTDHNVVISLFAKQKVPAPSVPAYLAHCVLLI